MSSELDDSISSSLVFTSREATTDIEYREYPQKIVVIIAFLLVNGAHSLTATAFNPISAQVADIYQVKPVVVSMNSLIQNLLFLPLTLPAGIVMERFGLRVSVWISAFLTLIGVWLRLFINENYYFVLGAHILMAAGFPFTQNMVTKISVVWFRAERRQMVTQIIVLLNMLFVLSSSLLPGLWMSGYDEKADRVNDHSKGKDLILQLMKIQAYFATTLVIVGSVLFKEKPVTPPSFTAEQKRESFIPSIKHLLKNKNYIIIFICYSIFCGNFQATAATISFIFKPYGFGSEITSFAGVGLLISGLVGSVIGGKLFKSNPKYRRFIAVGVIGAMCGYGLTLIFLPIENTGLIIVPYIIAGFASLQAFPIFLELASEIGYPVSETVTSGLLFGGSNFLGFVFGNIYTSMLSDDSKSMVLIVQLINIAVFGCCLIFIKFLKVELNRFKEDAKHEDRLKCLQEEIQEQNSSLPIIQSSCSSTSSISSDSTNQVLS